MGFLVFIIVFVCVLLLVDIYAFQAVKTAMNGNSPLLKRSVFSIYWLLTLNALVIMATFYLDVYYDIPKIIRMNMQGMMILTIVAKLLIVPFLLVDDIWRLVQFSINYFSNQGEIVRQGISRAEFLSQLGIAVGSIPFLGGLYGMISSAYRYKKHYVDVELPNLPASFEGLKIVQLSDIHSGSFSLTRPLKRAVEMVNEENADLLLFTGDLVNAKASEMEPYIDIFKKMKAKRGKYSVMGNHDYGFRWDDDADEEKNRKEFYNVHKQLGWRLLMNENALLKNGADEVAIVGVENWSSRHFGKKGDVKKALQGSENAPVKILLSHDPTHWDEQVRPEFPEIDLMLSGHTHGAQIGIELPGFRWSPSQYVFKQWAGLYKEGGQQLYINRGFGFLAYPGRVGILPEITVMTLWRERDSGNGEGTVA